MNLSTAEVLAKGGSGHLPADKAPSQNAAQSFDSPGAAMNAFGQAIRDNDEAEMKGMPGANDRDITATAL